MAPKALPRVISYLSVCLFGIRAYSSLSLYSRLY